MIGQCKRSSCRRTKTCTLLRQLTEYGIALDEQKRDFPDRRQQITKDFGVIRDDLIRIATENGCPNVPKN